MGITFCKPGTTERNKLSQHSFRSALIVDIFEKDVYDDYTFLGPLGSSSISTVSSVQRRDDPKNTTCFSLIKLPKRPKSDIIETESESSDDSISCNGKQIYALKTIDLKHICKEYIDELRNEIDILRTLDHPNIVKAYETYEYRRKLFLIMELCSGGDLHSRIPYTEEQSCHLIRKILLAVGYMHQRGIVHRDLKFENIMFESNNPDAEIKIIDFGLSAKFLPTEDIFTRTVGTLYTMAPEVMKGRYGAKVDHWSIGVLSYMLLSNRKPFWGKTKRAMIQNIMNCNYNFNSYRWAKISHDAKHFVTSLLRLDPEDRPSIEEALNSKWPVKNKPIPKHITRKLSDGFLTFSTNAHIKKLALAIIAHNATVDDVFNLREIFETFDTTKSGRITYDEFKEALSSHQYSEDDLKLMFSNADTFGDGHINYTEFLAATMETQGQIAEDKLKEVFRYLDRDESGFISKDNLKGLLSKTYTESFINEVISEADIDNDGQISFDEFLIAFQCRTKNEILAMRQCSLDGRD